MCSYIKCTLCGVIFGWLCETDKHTNSSQPQQRRQRHHWYGVYNNINSLCSFTEDEKKRFLWCLRSAIRSQVIVTTFIALFLQNITVYGAEMQSSVLNGFQWKLMSCTFTLTHTHAHAAAAQPLSPPKHRISFSTSQIQNGKDKDKTKWRGKKGEKPKWHKNERPLRQQASETGLCILIYITLTRIFATRECFIWPIENANSHIAI